MSHPLGVPVKILTDNVRSLVTRSDWNFIFSQWQNEMSKYEIEVRFREFTPDENSRSIVPNNRISYNTYNRLLQNLRKIENITETRTRNTITRYRQNDEIDYRNIDGILQRKTKRGEYISSYGFSVSRALEEHVNIIPSDLLSKGTISRDRYSFVPNNKLYRADLTQVTLTKTIDKSIFGVTNSGNTLIYWQFELEYTADSNPEKWIAFSEAVIWGLEIVQDSRNLYKLDDKNVILNDCAEILWQLFNTTPFEPRNELNAKLITQPRNLRLSEVSWGKLSGGAVTYTVTPKADGERKILYIRTDGLWLLSPPTNVRKLINKGRSDEVDAFLVKYNGTILDGELIPEENWRIPMGTPGLVAPELRIPEVSLEMYNPYPTPVAGFDWFLVFDCIVTNLALVINNAIPAMPLPERLNIATQVVGDWRRLRSREHRRINVKTNKLEQVDPKIFCQLDMKAHYQLVSLTPVKYCGKYPIFANVDPCKNFFVSMRFVLNQLDDVDIGVGDRVVQYLPYKTDGLIFTPISKYDPNTSKLPLHERQLEKYPDVMKWKPAKEMTVDLALIGNTLETWDNGYKPFGVLDAQTLMDPLLQNLPPHAVVEFSLVMEGDIVVGYKPKRLRLNKSLPNNIDVVKDNIDQARFPILPETLAGINTKLMAVYHNRIKKDLLHASFNELSKNNASLVALEVGAGYGENLMKLRKFRKIYAVEPDSNNFAELSRRVAQLEQENPEEWKGKVVLIKRGAEFPLPEIPDNSVDVVSLMLCLTFFWEPSQTPIKLMGLLRNIDRVLKVGGKICLLTMDGNSLEEYFGIDGLAGLYPNPMAGKTDRLRVNEARFGNAVIRAQGNGSIYINIPGTIVNQTEALVYLQDILKLQPEKYLVSKKGRADQEILLPDAHYQLSRMFNYAQLTKQAVDQRTIVMASTAALTSQKLTPSIGYEVSGPVLPASENPEELPTPMKVVIPTAVRQVAQGDDQVQLMPVGLPFINQPLSYFISDLISDLASENSPDRVHIDLTHVPVAEQIMPSMNWDRYLQGRQLGRVATIDDPGGVYSFYHAFLKGVLIEYQDNKIYGDRAQMAEGAYGLFVDFIKSGEYLKYADYVGLCGARTFARRSPSAAPPVEITPGMSQQDIKLVEQHNKFAYTQEELLQLATGPYNYSLTALVSALFKIHVNIWLVDVGLSSSSNTIIPLVSTYADTSPEIGNYPNGICLLAYYSKERVAQDPITFGERGLGLRFELLLVSTVEDQKQALFRASDPLISGLKDDFLKYWDVSDNVERLFAQGVPPEEILTQITDAVASGQLW